MNTQTRVHPEKRWLRRWSLSITHALILAVGTTIVVGCGNKTASAKDSQSVDTPRSSVVITRVDSPRVEHKPAVRLVEFGVHGVMADSVAKVEVAVASAVDTIPGLLTSLNPVATNDGTVHGIGMTEGGEAKTGYDYNSRTRRLTVFPLPSDLNGFFHEIALSSDAEFVAYVAHVQSGQTWAVVRSWPSMALVTRTPPSAGYPSDVGYDQVAWSGPDHVRISYRISSGPSIVVEGEPQTGKMKIDTVARRE
jgi:hypothetical protein